MGDVTELNNNKNKSLRNNNYLVSAFNQSVPA
jgi:hypothetical protein